MAIPTPAIASLRYRSAHNDKYVSLHNIKNKTSPGQMRLPWDTWEVVDSEVSEVAEKFVMANCYDPKIAAQFFDDA